jgi:hypothetical protein
VRAGRPLIVAAALLASAACASTEAGDEPRSPSRPPAAADVRIVYTVGEIARSPAAAARGRCPQGARCRVAAVRGLGAPRWALRAVRGLGCDPPAGDYADPRAACAALRRAVERRAGAPQCLCAAVASDAAYAAGVVDGRRVRVGLDFCSAVCGHGRAAARDVATLMPGAGG